MAAMPDTPRRPRIQWQDDTEYLKNRERPLSGALRPAAEPAADPAPRPEPGRGTREAR
ncbi:hypothetical protein GCM10009850_075620 [Nonomuraea monospora]|uniref:Uncharacterized protein n=2 Tax=Nonomuraea monospora TaxID=568818 RepID=A0ABN3CRN9_9ACTN